MRHNCLVLLFNEDEAHAETVLIICSCSSYKFDIKWMEMVVKFMCWQKLNALEHI